jgi:hypothetical protein
VINISRRGSAQDTTGQFPGSAVVAVDLGTGRVH